MSSQIILKINCFQTQYPHNVDKMFKFNFQFNQKNCELIRKIDDQFHLIYPSNFPFHKTFKFLLKKNAISLFQEQNLNCAALDRSSGEADGKRQAYPKMAELWVVVSLWVLRSMNRNFSFLYNCKFNSFNDHVSLIHLNELINSKKTLLNCHKTQQL